MNKKKIICYCCLAYNNKKLLILKNFPITTVNNLSYKNRNNLKKKFNLILYLCLNCKNIFYRHKFKYFNLYNNFNSRPFNYRNTKQYKLYFEKLKKIASITSKDLIYDIGKNAYDLKIQTDVFHALLYFISLVIAFYYLYHFSGGWNSSLQQFKQKEKTKVNKTANTLKITIKRHIIYE